MSSDYKNLGKVGYIKDGTDVYTFQIGSAALPTDPSLVIDPNNNMPMGPILLHVDNHSVLIKGPLNNNDDVIEGLFEQNRLIPELIEKQVRIIYGKGPHVYKAVFEKNKKVRQWETNAIIESWLDSFEDYGLDKYQDTAKKLCRRFYYFEEFYTKMIMRATRLFDATQRVAFKLDVPIVGFELVENKRCRLASSKNIDVFGDDLEEKDFQFVFVGNWTYGMRRAFKKYRKLNRNNLLNNAVGITHHKNDAVGKIYGINKFFEGIKDWILGSNLTPKNINSFIRNSIAAKIHIVVPNEWCDLKRDMLTKYCDINKKRHTDDETAELIKIKLIDGSYMELGTEFHEGLFAKYFKNEVEKCVRFLSGAENQGKAHATISFKDESGNDTQWKFEPIDLKYKEYVTSLIDYDKRADDVLIASKGLPANISNIDKDGVISKSGADLYYNYLIYLHTLTLAEEIIMQPFNLALKINFPELYAQGYRIGFYNDIPQKQEDTAPANRLNKQEL
jgi:hypothetical protein